MLYHNDSSIIYIGIFWPPHVADVPNSNIINPFIIETSTINHLHWY